MNPKSVEELNSDELAHDSDKCSRLQANSEDKILTQLDLDMDTNRQQYWEKTPQTQMIALSLHEEVMPRTTTKKCKQQQQSTKNIQQHQQPAKKPKIQQDDVTVMEVICQAIPDMPFQH